MKILKIIGIVLGVLLIIGAIGSSVAIGVEVADNLVYGNVEKDTREASLYQLNEWDYSVEAFDEKYKTSKLTVEAKDGVTVPVAILGDYDFESKDTVVLVHGYGGDYVSVYPQAEFYLEADYNVISIDQRGGGDSLDPKVSFGYFEKQDIEAVVDYVRSMSQNKLIIHGFSMGAATAGHYAGTSHAEKNDVLIVMDSSFDSMENMFVGVWDDMETGLPSSYAVWTGNIAMKLKYDFEFDDADACKALESCHVPVLIIQSERDDLAPNEVGEKIFNHILSTEKEIWYVDSKHIEGYIDFPIEYKERVFKFISTY